MFAFPITNIIIIINTNIFYLLIGCWGRGEGVERAKGERGGGGEGGGKMREWGGEVEGGGVVVG